MRADRGLKFYDSLRIHIENGVSGNDDVGRCVGTPIRLDDF
jgi:hypothetical protein